MLPDNFPPDPQILYGPPSIVDALPTIFLFIILPIIILVGFFIFLGKKIKKKKEAKKKEKK